MKCFLKEFLKVYPNIPPQALWRAIEAKLLYDQPIKQPLLDLGCGDGLFAKILFADKGKEIIGCDISSECVAKASLHNIYKSVTIVDARHLPYNDESFTTVLSNCVLEHIPEDEKVLGEVSRVLRKDGRFIFTVPSENFVKNLKTQNEKYVKNLNERLQHFHYRSPQEWERLLQQSGLTLEEFRYYLPKSVQQVWETYTQFFIKKVLGRELCGLLGTKKVGMYFIVRAVFPIVFNRYLRKWYLMGTSDNKEGGALLIVARKFRSAL
jgi:ubiquinone/menaquinone biosynthesis C-methylase UbiE